MVFDGTLDPTLTEDAAETTGWQDTLRDFVSTNVVEAMSTATMVPIIVFALLFGVALRMQITKSGDDRVLTFVDQIQQIVLTMIRLVMHIAPAGVFCLLAPLSGDVGFSIVTTALKYLGTTALGVAILFVLFVVVVTARTRLNPWRLPGKLTEQTAIAVTTTSSAVTFPTVLKNTVEKIGVSQKVANFTLSIGLTMGSYGAVLNYMIVVMFLAQAGGVDLTIGMIALGMALAILLNMGTITVPGGFPSSRPSSPRRWIFPSRPWDCSSPSTGSPGSSAPSSTSTATPSSRCSWRTPTTRSTATCTTSARRWSQRRSMSPSTRTPSHPPTPPTDGSRARVEGPGVPSVLVTHRLRVLGPQ